MTIAVRVDHLSKRYRIGASQTRFRYGMFRDVLVDVAMTPVRILRSMQGKSMRGADATSFIWALDDVSFDVEEGKVLGIVGRNGAGKSTLLKVLSRVTEPTKGTVAVRGRVGSLLEVGTGFHPELTGRENIYLNGAVLGMKRSEIDRKFDEIVDFSEVAQFIDTPVKRYSSGMYLRLAFAVAAHLEPEILVVDEVLAVGDAEFQKKCLGKMGDVAQQGRTVLFVSHNMSAILRLTQEAIVLKRGRLIKRGPTQEAVDFYLSSGQAETGERIWETDEIPASAAPFKPIALRLKDQEQRQSPDGSGRRHFVVDHHNDQDHERDGEVHQSAKHRRQRQDQPREINLRHHACIGCQRTAGGIERSGEEPPRQKRSVRKDRIWNALSRDFGNRAKHKVEHQHRKHRLNHSPGRAKHRLFITDFDIAPDHEEDQLTISPKITQVERRQSARRFDINCFRLMNQLN